MHNLIADLYPLCRSITGNGLRQTLNILRQQIPLEIHEVPSGTAVFDWTVPREWNIRDAYVRNPHGQKVIDFQKCNLHVVNYSIPVQAKMRLDELKEHLFTLPDRPDWIPYRTSYLVMPVIRRCATTIFRVSCSLRF
jgi:aminopeptidase-like protein